VDSETKTVLQGEEIIQFVCHYICFSYESEDFVG